MTAGCAGLASWGVGSVREASLQAASYLGERGCPSPKLDAQLLLAHVLGTDRVGLCLEGARFLGEEELSAFWELIRRRARHEPTAYLIGSKEFWSLTFQVDRRVLIPRADTEALLEEVERWAHYRPECSQGAQFAPERFVDVGCGSGCLAGALAGMFPKSRGLAIDIDRGALEVTRENLLRLGVAKRVEVREGNLLDPLDGESADLICANLPYIPTGRLVHLAEDIRWYEPLTALDGGSDGLALIHALVAQAPRKLNPEGFLVLEVGDGQADEVCGFCRRAGLVQVHTRRDLTGQPRVVAACRPARLASARSRG